MATDKETKPKKAEKDTVPGYSGSPHEGEKASTRSKKASADAVVSPIGHTEPTKVTTEKQT
jgi:hypothetical protein